MGWNFRKSIKIAPNVRLNIGKKGISGVSVGGKGLRFGIGRKGTRTSVSIPKTGLSYSTLGRTRKTVLPISKLDQKTPILVRINPNQINWVRGSLSLL